MKELPILITNQIFMMEIMKPFKDELLPFVEFNAYYYEKKTQYRVVYIRNKFLPNKELLNELFYPINLMNIEIDFLWKTLG